ncbi:MAG: hypothetical protein ACIAS6_07165 [Phycisphaerales bacterium JB060]
MQSPIPDEDPDCPCCDDLEFSLNELLATPRADDGATPLITVIAAEACCGSVFESQVCWCGPPEPSSVDHAGEQRLAVLSATRLTL